MPTFQNERDAGTAYMLARAGLAISMRAAVHAMRSVLPLSLATDTEMGSIAAGCAIELDMTMLFDTGPRPLAI